MDDEAKRRTQETANKLFGKGIKMDPPYRLWKEFDKDLANDLSMFITGNLYSRTVLTLQERQMAACAMLAALRAGGELKLHLNAALNVGCDPKKLTEIFFQLAPYGGMPAVNEALQVFREVLKAQYPSMENTDVADSVVVARLGDTIPLPIKPVDFP
jgi:4-carboxymuconolactone decarboxylase